MDEESVERREEFREQLTMGLVTALGMRSFTLNLSSFR